MSIIYLISVSDTTTDGYTSNLRAFKDKEAAKIYADKLSILIKEYNKEWKIHNAEMSVWFQQNPQPQPNYKVIKNNKAEIDAWKTEYEKFTKSINNPQENPKYKDVLDYTYSSVEIEEIELED